MAATAHSAAEGPDHPAGSLLRHLSRPHRELRLGGPLWGAVAAVLTFGLWPLIRWPARFHRFVLLQRNQLWHVSEWMRLRSGYGEAERLRRAAERIGFRPALWLMSMILWMGAAAEIGYTAWLNQWTGSQLLESLFRPQPAGSPWSSPGAVRAHIVWIVALTGAFLLHWVQVQLHARDVRRVVRALDDLARRDGLTGLSGPRIGPGLQFGWVVAGVALCVLGAWWGIGLALAAGAHARLVERRMPRLRRQIADALRAMLVLRRPAMRVPAEVLPSRRCGNDRCHQQLPPQARFCPRCGTAVPA